MNDQTRELLEELATSLGVGIEQLWQAGIQVGFARGVAELAGAAMAFIVVGAGITLIRSGLKYERKSSYDERGESRMITGTIAALVGFIFAGVLVVDAVVYLLAPQAWLLENIFRGLR